MLIRRLRAVLRFLAGSGGGSSQQMARGSVWVFVTYGLGQVITVARSVVLARLLLPADFGLMNIASLSTAALLVFTETGIWPALIQRKELDRDTLNTAWLICSVRGAVLGTIAVALAPVAAWFFQEPLVGPVLRVLGLTFVISGCNSLSPILLQKELEFRPIALLNVSTAVANMCCASVAAFALRSVWALVIGEVAGTLVACVVSYWIHPFRPRLRFVRERARELLHFGRYITAGGVVTYLCTQGDNAYVGKVLGAEPLGFYGMAYRLANLPATSISHVIGRVTLSSFSQMQDDLPRLRSYYLQTLRLTALISVPLAGAMAALAPYVVNSLYGSQWMPVVPSLMVLCIYGLERSIGSVAGPVFLALGRPRLVFRLGLVKLVVMVLAIAPLTARYGIVGTAIAVTISAFAIQCAVVPATARLLQTPARDILAQLLKPTAATLLMVGVIMVLRGLGSWPLTLGSLVVLAAAGGVAYGLVVLPTERDLLRKVVSIISAASAAQDRVT